MFLREWEKAETKLPSVGRKKFDSQRIATQKARARLSCSCPTFVCSESQSQTWKLDDGVGEAALRLKETGCDY